MQLPNLRLANIFKLIKRLKILSGSKVGWFFGWLVGWLQCWADTNVTLAFQDAQVILPFSSKEKYLQISGTYMDKSKIYVRHM